MHVKAALALLLLFSIYGTVFSADTWYSPSWQYRRTITLNETRNITRINEPVYVTISGTDGRIGNCTKELRITDANGAEIPSQVDSDSVAGGTYSCTAVFMANSSALGSNTYYAYYGNPSASAPSYPSQDASFSAASSLLKNSYYNLPTDSYGFPYPSFSSAGSGSYDITMATGRPYCDNQRWMFSIIQNGTGYDIGSGGGCTNPVSSWSVGKNGAVFKEIQANFGTNPSATYYWRTRLFPKSRYIEVSLDARLSAAVNLTDAWMSMVPGGHSTAWDQYSSVSSTTMYMNTNSSWGTYGSGSVIFGNVRNVTLNKSIAGWEGGVGLHIGAYLLAMPSNALACASYPCTYTYSFRLAWTTDYTVAANRITGNMLDGPLSVSVGPTQSFFISAGISPVAKAAYPNTNETFSLWLNNNQSIADNFTLSCTGTCYYSENPVAAAAGQNRSVTVMITSAGVSGTTAYLITAASAANASNFAAVSASITVDAAAWRDQWTDAFGNTYAYRMPITVTNNGSALTDYQVAVNTTNLAYNNAGLVGSWHFSESAGTRFADSSGNGNDGTYAGEALNNGTLTNFAFNASSGWVGGKYGNALRFDGVNDYVNMGDVDSVEGAQKATYMAWVNPSLTNAYYPIVTKYDSYVAGGGGAGGFSLVLTPDNRVQFFISDTSDNRLVASSSSAPAQAGQWQQVAAVFDGSQANYLDKIKIYFNGVEQGLTFMNTYGFTLIPNTPRPLRLGAARFSDGSWGIANGSIDDVRIYTRALSPTDVAQAYQNNTFMRSSLAGYWRLDEGAGTGAYDTHHVATEQNRDSTKSGNALSLDGADDYVDAGNSAGLNSAFDGSYTVEMWMKSQSAAALKGLFEKRDTATGSMMAFFNYPSTGKVKFYSGSNIDGDALDSTASDLNNGRWRHLVFQLDGTTQRIYVDGALDNSRTKVGGTSSDGALRIGRLSTTYFDGTVDEVRVYNRSLSASEIAARYSAGKPRLDYADLRFTNSSLSQMPYWLESDSRAWVRVPYVPNGTSTVYAYYGSTAAQGASNGNATFLLFDDFHRPDSTTVGNGWAQGGSASVASNQLRLVGTGSSISRSDASLANASVEASMMQQDATVRYSYYLIACSSGGKCGQNFYRWDTRDLRTYSATGEFVHGSYTPGDRFRTFGMSVRPDGLLDFHQSGTRVRTGDTGYAGGANYLSLQQDLTGTSYAKWILVRRYASPEPSLSLQQEESTNPFAILGVSPAGRTTSPNYNETFTLWAYNNQTVSDTFTLSCAGACSVSPSSLPLTPYQNGSATVTITSANVSGTTNYQITAASQANASNFVSISVSITVDITRWRDQWTDAYGNVFKYRVPITVTNSGSALADYQVGFAIDTASPISAGKMGGDCGGIRITNGTNEIPYWVESGCNTTGTVLWARDPYLPAGNSTIYAYYGSFLVAGASNGTSTFVFFDDFPGTSLDPAKWTSGAFSPQYGAGSVVVANSIATVTGGTNTWWGMFANGAAFTTPPFTVEFLFKGASGPHAGVETTGTLNPSPRDAAGFWYDGGGYGSCNNNACNTEGAAPSISSYSLLRVDIYGGGVKYFVNRSLAYTKTTNVPDEGMKVYMAAAQPGGKAYADWVFIRKYAPTEPAALSGSEQSKGYRTLVRRCGLAQENATVTAYQLGNVSGSCASDSNGICVLEISAGTYDLQFLFADNSAAWKNGTAFG